MKEKQISFPPAINTPSAGDTSFPEMTKLSNGVPVYLIPGGSADLFRVEIVFRAGQVEEKVHLSASMTNAMLTEGTQLHDAITINELIDSTGAVFTHSAEKETAGLVFITLPRKFGEVTALAAETLFMPAFPENEFRILRDKRIQSFLTNRQKTSVIAREKFYEALCGVGNPYSRITSIDDYRSLSAGDLRDFHAVHYTPDRMYITVAGREPHAAIDTLEKHFASGTTVIKGNPLLPCFPFDDSEPRRIFAHVEGSVQSSVRMGWKGIERKHDDYHSLQVATMILGGYFGSRLMRNIREEKGYTYGIHAVAGAFRYEGFITIMAEVANEYREATIEEIKKEIAILREQEVDDSEMQVVRNHLMGEMARAFDGPFSKAEAFRNIIDDDSVKDFYTRFTETVVNITPARIREIFNTYFDPDRAWEIIAGAE